MSSVELVDKSEQALSASGLTPRGDNGASPSSAGSADVVQVRVDQEVTEHSADDASEPSEVGPDRNSDTEATVVQLKGKKAADAAFERDASWTGRLRDLVESLPKVVILPLLIGSFFGAALQRGKVHEFYFVRQQMVWQRHLMLKMFLAAAATSVAMIALMKRFGSSQTRFNLSTTSAWMTTKAGRGFPATLLGCFLVGVAMPITGSCPGTVFSQLGAGSSQAWLVLAGGLLGAALFYAVHYVTPHLGAFMEWGKLTGAKSSIPTLLNLNYYVVAAALSLGMVGIVLLFEVLYPWKEEVASLYPTADATWEKSLPGGVAGLIIGLLQLPLVSQLGNHLGCSSSYCTTASNLLFFFKGSQEWQVTRQNWWQVFLVTGMALGSFASGKIADEHFMSDNIVSDTEAVLGGALFVVGARLAAGCTSGHGISGVGYLSTQSLFGTAAMFGGGLAAGFALYA